MVNFKSYCFLQYFNSSNLTDWQKLSLEWSALLLLIGCLVFIAGSSLWGRECLHIKWSAVHCSIGQRLVYSVSMATLSPNQIFQLACANYFLLLNAHCTNCTVTLANLIWRHITSLQIWLYKKVWPDFVMFISGNVYVTICSLLLFL